METAPQQQGPFGELSRQAIIVAESLAKQELKCDVLAEVVGHQSQWTESRVVFKQHMRIWQQFTTVCLAVGADGSVAGWLVENRKARCGSQILTDADIEKRSRTIRQIRRDFRLAGVRRISLDEQRGMAVASFAGPDRADDYEVSVNHTTGELIGFMPIPTGGTSPLPTKADEADAARELAWQQIEADLRARLGPDAADHARDALRLDPQSALRDETRRSFWDFRLWRFFTTCDVSIDQATKEVVGWYVEALQSEVGGATFAEAAAVQAARSELRISQGVQGPSVTVEKTDENEKASVHWWHAENGINVEGDQTTVLVNATTGKVFSVARKWRKIPRELLKPPAVSKEQAVRAADRATKRDSGGPNGKVLGQNIIQVAADPNQPSPTRDVLVWRVGYSEAGGIGFTEVSVDCQAGEVVRITGW